MAIINGGFADGFGAAAFVVVCVREHGGRFESILLGARGLLIKEARSAFHAEVTALDMATQFMCNLAVPKAERRRCI